MVVKLQAPDVRELKPRITVFGVGGGGGNAVNNMIELGLQGVDFVVANTDAQALAMSRATRIIQMGLAVTEGLGAGSQPDVGRAAAEEVIDEIRDHLAGQHMIFITAGMGGGTGTGAAPVVARAARELGILTVGVVTKPFMFEGQRRMRMADQGIQELQESVDTLIVIPNQNLFRVATEQTGFADAFGMADQVLYSGVACITDLMVRPGLINLDFADVRSVMRGMGKAMMGTGEASGDKRALMAAQAAVNNPLLDDSSMKGARGLLISITGGRDMKLYEVDEAASRIREEVDEDANIIVGATFDEALEGVIRVSVVATGIDKASIKRDDLDTAEELRIAQIADRLKQEARARAAQAVSFRPQATPVVQASEIRQSAPVLAEEPAASLFADHAVRIEQVQPRVMEAPTPAPAAREPEFDHRADAPFIPPAPERLTIRPARMPRVDELPMPVQAQIAAREPQQAQAPTQEPRHASIMQKLASFGFGRKEESVPAPVPAPQVAAPAPRPSANEYMRRAPTPVAQRPAQGQLDTLGRQPAQRTLDDEQMEIPAFLRRQSS
jgi:cell division protein FtsZ